MASNAGLLRGAAVEPPCASEQGPGFTSGFENSVLNTEAQRKMEKCGGKSIPERPFVQAGSQPGRCLPLPGPPAGLVLWPSAYWGPFLRGLSISAQMVLSIVGCPGF